MGNIKILDCTLRDGGYVNEWNFGRETIKNIICKLSEARINFIECGFLSDGLYNDDRSIFNNTKQIRKMLPDNSSSCYVAMIALGEKEISVDKVPLCDKNTISAIRLTFHKDEIDRAFEYAKQLINKEYDVFMQPIGTCMYSDRELLELVDKINELHPYALGIVDTLGNIKGPELMRMFQLLDNNLDASICIGFHSHNNLQLSFANAQDLVRVFTERTIIIDSSVLGMGRGAGNLCTELITQFLNENLKTDYDIASLLEIVDNYLLSIKAEATWGYTIPYYMSAIHNCHPNYAIYLMNRQTVTVKDIEKILVMIPKEERGVYNKKIIERLYNEYQSHAIDDKKTIKCLRAKWYDKKVLILAPGKTLLEESEKIQNYIRNEKPYIISVNFIDEMYGADMIFVSNLKRFKKSIEGKWDKELILTSNIDVEESKNVYKVNYSDYLDAEKEVSDNSGLMLCKLLKKSGVQEIALAGFDGFEKNNENNYFRKELNYNAESISLEIKTQKIKEQFKKIKEYIKIVFITTSCYSEV